MRSSRDGIGDGADEFAFLGGGGKLGSLIRNHDWRSTPLGPVAGWPQSLRTAVSLLLQSAVPIVLLWGEDGIMIYNDAYSIFAGHRHPQLLGSNVREGWREVSEFNDNVMRVCLAGGTLAYRDQELTLSRDGFPKRVWMDLDYSPLLDETGRPAGVLAIVVETTERVLADRRNTAEHERLQRLFVQAPTFMAMLRGADHRFELLNPECMRLIGHRDVIGKPAGIALPEIADQGFVRLLDDAFENGEALSRTAARVVLRDQEGGDFAERYLDFVFQPIRNDDGKVTHIFVQGSDVTERIRGEEHKRRLIDELNHRVRNTLASMQSIVAYTLRGQLTKPEASAAISARIMAISRSHDILTKENWAGAELAEIVSSMIRSFEGMKERFHVGGPSVRLGPRAAMSISLGLHELASNAIKHGALSNGAGSVAIVWDRRGGDSDAMFNLTWRENGGPFVSQPDVTGFGSQIVLRGMPLELRGKTNVDYAPSGVVFTLQTSLAALQDQSFND